MEGQPGTPLDLPLGELAEEQASSSHASNGEQLGVDTAMKQSSELPAERYSPGCPLEPAMYMASLDSDVYCSAGVASRNGAKAPSIPAEEDEGGSQHTPDGAVLNTTSAVDR